MYWSVHSWNLVYKNQKHKMEKDGCHFSFQDGKYIHIKYVFTTLFHSFKGCRYCSGRTEVMAQPLKAKAHAPEDEWLF